MTISESDLQALGLTPEVAKAALALMEADARDTPSAGISALEVERVKRELTANFEARLDEQKKFAEAEIRNLKYRYAIDTKIAKAGVRNETVMQALLEADRDKIKVDENGSFTGIEERLAYWKGVDPTLFKDSEETTAPAPAKVARGMKPMEPTKPEPEAPVEKSRTLDDEIDKMFATMKITGA